MTPAFFQCVVTVEDLRMLGFGFDSGKRTLNKQRLDVNAGTTDTGGFLLSCALIVLRSKSRPRTKVLGSRKDRHIHTDFGDYRDCRKGIKTGNGTNKIDLLDILFGD